MSEEALWQDGHNEPHRGIGVIKAAIETIGQLVPSTTANIKKLIASGGVVMVERVDVFEFKGETITMTRDRWRTTSSL